MSAPHLGLTRDELAAFDFAQFWNPRMRPLASQVRCAVLRGPVAAPLLCDLRDAPAALVADSLATEDGHGFDESGALHVAARTELPGCSPAQVDWWFGWHGSDARRYKLWHPRAHVRARWAAPDAGERHRGYVGRTSLVDEYLGSKLVRAAIRFVPPAELGFADLAVSGAVAICARIGLPGTPLEAGTLVHFVRPVAGGAVMQSLFWLGGRHARARLGPLGSLPLGAARALRPMRESEGRDLLVHCAEEMAHLATFLPALARAAGGSV